MPGGSVTSVLTGFHHVTLNVTDLSRARAFYEGVLGLEVDQDFPGEKLRLRIGETGPGGCHLPRPRQHPVVVLRADLKGRRQGT